MIDEGRHAASDVLEQFVIALSPLDFVQLVIDHRVIAPQHHGLAQFRVSGHYGRQLEQVLAVGERNWKK